MREIVIENVVIHLTKEWKLRLHEIIMVLPVTKELSKALANIVRGTVDSLGFPGLYSSIFDESIRVCPAVVGRNNSPVLTMSDRM